MSDKIEHVGPIEEDKHTSPIVKQEPDFRQDKMEQTTYNCYYNGKEYSNGAYLCQVGELFQCSYGVWVDQDKECNNA